MALPVVSLGAGSGSGSWGWRRRTLLAAAVLAAAALLAAAQDADPGYPTYHEVPAGLAFTCQDKKPGYYADPDTRCQVWHWCLPSGSKFSFLCPNGTVFNQAVRVCDWAHNVDCAQAPQQYSVNDDLYRDKDGNYI
ncbi:hypothetical protein R5R35_009150 [Gryllus longicercus]|uniref:Chitin-binding type-2 domain-containing protein n=1 Tax=Gryllus longicercus TaxID=2509291 RepID=A0AAN9V8T0_9ORTH